MSVRDTLRKLAPVIGTERASHLWRAYLTSDSKERRELEGVLEAYAAESLGDIPSATVAGLFPPPPPERCLGDIELGHIRYAGKKSFSFGLRRDELLRHVGLYGSSGSGKSNAIALILDGLGTLSVPFLLCDFKRTFRAMLKDDPNLLVFTAGDGKTAPFGLNPLVPPPGTSVEVWAKKVIGALSHAYCQGAGSESLLVSAINTAYAESAKQGRWPSFCDVARVLDTQPAKGRRGMWMDSARRAVTSVSSGNAGEVFCPERATDLIALLNERVVLELDLLNQSEQTFLSEVLILWLIQHQMNNEKDRETLKYAIVIEEAHHLLRSPPGVGDGSEPVIHTALREIRELGLCSVLATQDASIVPIAVFGNQATTLAFHTKHQRDVSSTAQAMLLKDEAKDELGRLPVGEAIVRVPRWPDPAHISIKLRPIAKGTVTDQDIRQHMADKAYSGDSAAFCSSPPDHEPPCAIPRGEDNQKTIMESPSSQTGLVKANPVSPATTPKEKTVGNTCLEEPSHLELDMLADIVRNPFDGVVQRIRRLGTSRRKGSAALNALVTRGLTQSVNVFTGNAVTKLFDLTKQGRGLCHTHGIGPLPGPTEGGVEHRYWTRQIADALASKGWSTCREHAVSSEVTVDVQAERGGRIVAVLFETGHSNVKGNILKTVKAGYSEIWIVSNNPKVKITVDAMELGNEHPASIRFIQPTAILAKDADTPNKGGRVG